MTINWATTYPANVDTSDSAFPYGKPRDESSQGAGDGTPLDDAWVSDLAGGDQALLDFAGIVPSNTPDEVDASQKLQALIQVANASGVYGVGGGAPNYLLLPQASSYRPALAQDGHVIVVSYLGTNMASAPGMTFSLDGSTAHPVKNLDGADFGDGDLPAGAYAFRFDGTNWVPAVSRREFRVLPASSFGNFVPTSELSADSVWESFGPTGSGATRIITNLNSLPKSCSAILFRASLSATISAASTPGLYRGDVRLRPFGGGNQTQTVFNIDLNHHSTALSTACRDERYVWAPADAQNRFEMIKDVDDLTTTTVSLTPIGYML